MKKKFIFIAVIATTLIVAMAILLQAIIREYEQKSVLTGETLASVEEGRKKIKEKGSLTEEKTLELANEYISKITNKETMSINAKDTKVEYVQNNIKSRKEATVTIGKATVEINADTGEFLSYYCSDIEGEKNKKSEEEIKKMAKAIFIQSGLVDAQEYVLYELTQFDEDIWRAWFAKKDGDIVNISDNVKFSFVPMTGEIIVLARGNIEYDNNEVVITVQEAKEIAKEYMKKVSATDMEVKLDIVVPNYYWVQENNGLIYKDIDKSRKSYVITFNDEFKTKLYIDCTTGEVIGGDSIL